MEPADLQRERELKLILGAEVPLPTLDGLGGLRVRKLESRDLVATYWDTSSLALARWGCTLRHRNDQGWCAKLAVGHDDATLARDEVVVPGAADDVPDQIAGALAPFVRNRPLGPVADIAASRDVFEIAGPDGRNVGIITDDRVVAVGASVRTAHFREVEIELADGCSEAEVEPLVAAIAEVGGDDSDPRPKLLRALDLPARPIPEVVVPTVPKDPTSREVVHAAVAAATLQVIEHLPVAWIGVDTEGVHQSRVAMRRLRSDLGTFGGLVDRRSASELRSELAWLGSILGAVRDADVVIAKVEGLGDATQNIARDSYDALRQALSEYRSERQASMRDALRSERAGALLETLVAASADPPTVPQADDPATEAMRTVVRRRWARVRRRADGLTEDSPEPQLHALRIQAKRLRYAAEAARPAMGDDPGPARLAKAAAKLQSSLGELSDAAVATKLLAQIASSDEAAAFAAGQISGLLSARGQKDRRRWRRRWKQMDRRRTTAWLDR